MQKNQITCSKKKYEVKKEDEKTPNKKYNDKVESTNEDEILRYNQLMKSVKEINNENKWLKI